MAASKSPAQEMGGLTLAQLSQPEISGQLFTLQPPSSVNWRLCSMVPKPSSSIDVLWL